MPKKGPLDSFEMNQRSSMLGLSPCSDQWPMPLIGVSCWKTLLRVS